MLEVAVTEIGLSGCVTEDHDPLECLHSVEHLLHLFMSAQARLVRVSDGTTLSEWQLHYKSSRREIQQWAENDGRLLGEKLEDAFRDLVEQVYDVVFLITSIDLPTPGNDFWDGSDCWLAPVYPPNPLFRNPVVDTLRPTLQWSAFPRELDRQKLNPEVLRKIDNVTYDLRIWDVDPHYPSVSCCAHQSVHLLNLTYDDEDGSGLDNVIARRVVDLVVNKKKRLALECSDG